MYPDRLHHLVAAGKTGSAMSSAPGKSSRSLHRDFLHLIRRLPQQVSGLPILPVKNISPERIRAGGMGSNCRIDKAVIDFPRSGFPYECDNLASFDLQADIFHAGDKPSSVASQDVNVEWIIATT